MEKPVKNSKFAEYILKKSGQPGFGWIVFFLTLCESVFLFIPPEVFIAPGIIADKKRAWPIVAAASLGSLVGGAIAYMIGFWLFDSVGTMLIQTFSSMEHFGIAQQMFTKYGLFIIFLAAFSPVPYKLMAICAGFMAFNPFLFIGISAIFRTLRFSIVGYLLWKFSDQANLIIKKYFWPLAIGSIVAAFLGIGLILVL